jgi:hypothetical protein
MIGTSDFIQPEPDRSLNVLFEISLCVSAEPVMRVIVYNHSVFVKIIPDASGVGRYRPVHENNTEFSALMELGRWVVFAGRPIVSAVFQGGHDGMRY